MTSRKGLVIELYASDTGGRDGVLHAVELLQPKRRYTTSAVQSVSHAEKQEGER